VAIAVNQSSQSGSRAVLSGGRKRGANGVFAAEEGPKKKIKAKRKEKKKGVKLMSITIVPLYKDGLKSKEREKEREDHLEIKTP
jgi:hypothetical protein